MRTRRLLDTGPLPLLVEPAGRSQASLDALTEWAVAERSQILHWLETHGGLLLRDFRVESSDDFERCCRAFEPSLKPYVGGESPRTAVSGDVYTSTEYPAHLEIALHSEMSYSHDWPQRLFFFCAEPAASGGETPLADTRHILAAIDPAIAARFEALGVMYLNNYHGGWGLGKSWQETYLTSERLEVERELEAAGMDYRWSDEGLWTRAVRPAIIRHPSTAERVWFNQADRWHVSSRGEDNAAKLLRMLGEDGLARHARYGDGSAIEGAELDDVRAAYAAAERRFPWCRGDLLVLDNVLTAHGRKPFTGERRVLVAMA